MFFAAEDAAKGLDARAGSRPIAEQETLLGPLQAREGIVMTLGRNAP